MIIKQSPYPLSQFKSKYPNIAGLTRGVDIKRITVHGTGGSYLQPFKYAPEATTQGLRVLRDMYDQIRSKSGRFKDYISGIALYHFLIDNDGTVYQLIDTEKWVFHSSVGVRDSDSIGIELNNPKSKNYGGYTSAQYKSLNELTLYLLKKHSTIDTITGHGAFGADLYGIYKHCPGKQFDWSGYKSYINARGYEFEEKTVQSTIFQPGGTQTRKSRRETHIGEYLYNITLDPNKANDGEKDISSSEEVAYQNSIDYSDANEGNENTEADIFSDHDLSYNDSGFELIANEEWQVEITPQGPQQPTDHNGVQWIEIFAPQIKIDDKKVLVNQISWIVPPGACSYPSYTHKGGNPLEPITATATKTKGDNQPVMRENDEGTCNCQFVSGGSTINATCKFKIQTAGQNSTKGE